MENDQTSVHSPRNRRRTHDLKLTFDELTLIYKALQAVRTLGVLPPNDELLDETIELIDEALTGAL